MSVAMVVPTRGRPDSVARMGEAWELTDSWISADLWWIIDADDPAAGQYQRELSLFPWMHAASIPKWQPMVPKLNWAARQLSVRYPHVGFMGDDHLPRTPDWPVWLAAALEEMGTGIAYGRDGLQDEKLPTWWVMTSNIVRALGRMVPANVEHLYCDNAVKELGSLAGVLRYMPHVLIEHMHPAAGKAQLDHGYLRANGDAQYARDGAAFAAWVELGLARDATLIADLREA